MKTQVKTVTTLDIYGRTHLVPTDELTWRPSAYGIIINNGKILLCKQLDGGYDLPGGGIELGELPEAGVIREIKEETGMDADSPLLVAVRSNFFSFVHLENQHFQSILMYYVCNLTGGTLGEVTFDEFELEYASHPEWLPLTELPNINISSSIDWREIVAEYSENSRH